MDLVDCMKAFVATAQTGSFTEAANRLGMSNRLTSKYVAELESRIGTRLLQRTTRKVGLTPAGEDLLARAPALLDELDDLIGSMSEQSKGFTGLLRISAPVTFGEVYIHAMIRRFAAQHPALKIDLRLSDAYIDLAKEGIDLAFRIGTPSVSSLKARKLGMLASHLVASPDYVAQYGAPSRPEDLVDHRCIVDTNRRDPSRWTFIKAGETSTVQTNRHFMVNSARVANEWAIAGEGVAYCPAFVVADAMDKGALVPLLPDYQMESHPISAVYLSGTVLPRKVRGLIDFALADIRDKGLLE
ncbi:MULTISPECIES: LysR family transcriptional regulator [Cohaesibacter]|uniref:LysR family transcriptional regulator n=1 Tax=Cohaesibacter TaxID=655352 RepID=UPI000DE8E88E|nr:MULTISPECIES: LysR family transcriptional regulator [Cohaesibacter]TLP45030.1 LysR family transcriptional regulator [Cohaesibacter sp. CAU 1516]